MTYFDDILNVNAYLREKMRKTAETSQVLMERIEESQKKQASLKTQADALLAQAEALAAQLGIDVPQDPDVPALATDEEASDCVELLIRLPDNYDFSMAFEKLRQEAHAAGFTNVHPEELLSPDEMDQAERFHQEVESRFEQATELHGKDIAILAAAVAARIICKAIFSVPLPKEDQAAAMEVEQHWTGMPVANDNTDHPAPAIDALEGVDLKALDLVGLQNNAQTFADTLSQSERMISQFTGRTPKTIGIKMDARILQDSIPFDMPDNEYFGRDDALGYNRWLGWIFGVMNIMTDTVTTKQMRSFAVDQPIMAGQYPTIVQKISTPLHLMLPVMTSRNIKDSLLAAVVREAGVLQVTKAPPQEVARVLTHTFQEEQKNISLLQEVGNAAQVLPPKLGLGSTVINITRDTAIAAFLNQLITAVHALLYDPEQDGAVETYTIRTNKILTISNTIATVFNSIPALIEQNPAKIDYAGVITTCLSVFNSTRFWIDIKTNYLVSVYQPGVEEQMSLVNKYFEFIPTSRHGNYQLEQGDGS